MIHEYGLEPSMVATWGNRHDFRYFVEKFGLGQPRIVSRYPRDWKRLVWEAFRSQDDFERKRMEELLARLAERQVKRRGYLWEPQRTWLQNAHAEHGRAPFHAILASVNPNEHPATIVADELEEATTPLWAAPRGRAVARSAREMAAAIAAMLRIAEVVILVDPHFGPERPRYRRPLEAFLRAVLEGRPTEGPRRVEVHTSLELTGTRAFFEAECQDQLPRCLPQGISLALLRLATRPGGQRLHNRYVLTDVGGVVFGIGLDDGNDVETDDLTLMDRAQYEMRWAEHSSNPMAFETPEGTIEIRRGE
jgi:hypothetical protein